jgi:hypothetical protein
MTEQERLGVEGLDRHGGTLPETLARDEMPSFWVQLVVPPEVV